MRRTKKLCDCGRGDILLGEQARFNARNNEGKPICPTCKLEEFYAKYYPNTETDDSSE